ncbi:MAG: hypothetical protein HZC40_18410 [Chloroflexi bacterium]|nr:hypothetical protein [Chloroflexota bacterium]
MNSDGNNLRNGILLVALVFAVTLALIVGNRLSNEALAVLVGAVCGISATVPVSIALFIAASRNWGRAPEPAHYEPRTQPPVIVVSPPQLPQAHYGYAGAPYFLPPTISDASLGTREFKIIGEE